MPRPHPPEIRAGAIRLARSVERPIREAALGLGISESCLRRWLDQGDVDGGRTEGLTSGEQEELCGCGGRIGCCGRSGRS